eukprot:scaffold31198_cov36-Phaeocystis_antarctica.AAC.2
MARSSTASSSGCVTLSGRAFQLVKWTSIAPAATATSGSTTSYERERCGPPLCFRLPLPSPALVAPERPAPRAVRNGGGTSMAGATCTSPGLALARRPGHPHEWSLHREPSHLEKCCHHAAPKALFGLPRKAPLFM